MIEKSLPLHDINLCAEKETLKKGHPGNLHPWWNRSPIISSTALLFAALIDSEDDLKCEDYQNLIKGICANDKNAFLEAKEILSNLELPTISDVFSGFGGLSFACELLNVNSEAGDLNAVASLLTKALVELPAKFNDVHAVHPHADSDKTGMVAVADDIAYYADILEQLVIEKVANIYPAIHGLLPYSWVWVRTIECPNPACACEMPLANSFVLSKIKGHEKWVEPKYVGKKLYFEIHDGVCPKNHESNKVGVVGAKFKCPVCGETTTETYIRKMGKDKLINMRLMAAGVFENNSKEFYSIDENEVPAISIEEVRHVPDGKIPEISRWFSPPVYGFENYSDLFTKRQLVMLTAFCHYIPSIMRIISEDAERAGMKFDDTDLCNGGNGSKAYGQAIVTYLSLAISKMINYHSTACTWDNRTGTGRAAFMRQAIPMTWTFAEENPFSMYTGSFRSIVSAIVEVVKALPANRIIPVKKEDAIDKLFIDNSILFTELPYYDFVGYADLSDYFYIWLKKCLSNVFPELFKDELTDKNELSSIPEHFQGDIGLAKSSYEQKIKSFFSNFAKYSSPDYPSVVFYLFSKEDRLAFENGFKDMQIHSALSNLLQSIIDAGFSVSAMYPVRIDKPSANEWSVRIAIVFRKNCNENQLMTRRSLVTQLGKELPDVLQSVFNELENDTDRLIVSLGKGLSIATQYRNILNADGTIMDIRDYIVLIYQEIKKLFALFEEDIRDNYIEV